MTKLNVKKILVLGSGGRENAICEAFKNSPQATQIFALPGNAGTKKIAENIENININDFSAIVNFCQNNKIDFVFIWKIIDGIFQNFGEFSIFILEFRSKN